jgi:hypothetical protein
MGTLRTALGACNTFGDNALTLTLRAFVDSVDVRISTIICIE